jgi:AcrR family transcriptional regulator
MTDVKKVSRQVQAAATRRRMLDASYTLFCELGYRATTMQAVAERAGVAVQTVYFTFHTKDALLQEVHNWTVLGDDPTPPEQQEWWLDAQGEPDVRQFLVKIVEGASGILRRVAPMIPVFHTVSSDAAGAEYRRVDERRRRGYAALAEDLGQRSPFRPGLTSKHVSDLLFVLLGPEFYRSFVIELGWTHDRWVRWTTDTLLRDLYGIDATID